MMRKDEEESRGKSSNEKTTTPNLQIDFSKYQSFIEEVVKNNKKYNFMFSFKLRFF
jgi:hypothetical protein